jgi:ribosomal-protein-alanine N-acetyltransferase
VLDALHAALAAAGVERIFAEVRASNAPAIALYLDRGYREVGIRRAYYRDGEDARILACDL